MDESVWDLFSRAVKGLVLHTADHTKRLVSRKARELQRGGAQLRQLVAWTLLRPKDAQTALLHWTWLNALTVTNILILVWFLVLRWGEFSVFNDSMNSCQWHTWETLPQDPPSHHLVFVADPQLVDPHTYPGRPWPLSTLTIKHTDLYLKRSYSRIQTRLDPDTIIFLGDLFDGGREWSTRTTKSPDEQFMQYGDLFWQKEFRRFGNIFLKEWGQRVYDYGAGHVSRTVITSLPGNHDLGFGGGIQIPVRERFQSFFGESNRIDIIGNHTFVSIDTPSLSARDQVHREETRNIWQATEEFLENANETKALLIDSYMRLLSDQPQPLSYHEHKVHELHEATWVRRRFDLSATSTDFPTVLLSHVPLFRDPGTPCGPLRERHPPSMPPLGSTEPVFPDDQNAISISAGYQYQNVISKETSSWILEKLGGAVKYAFSGDDHDYCDIVHKGYPSPIGGIREITVKSISWAMGVRRPGFLMVGLWNPVDDHGKALHSEERTLETHLCLLPDQLSIFIRYATLFGISIVVLFFRSLIAVTSASHRTADTTTLLPLSSASYNKLNSDLSNGISKPYAHTASSSTSSSSPEDPSSYFSGRSNGIAFAPHSSSSRDSPVQSYGYGLGTADGTTSPMGHTRSRKSSNAVKTDLKSSSRDVKWTVSSLDDEVISTSFKDKNQSSKFGVKRKSFCRRWMEEWAWSLWVIARIVLLWYIYLLFY